MQFDDKENDFYRCMRVLKAFLLDKKVGKVEINCFKGGVSSVNVHETINWKAEKKQQQSN